MVQLGDHPYDHVGDPLWPAVTYVGGDLLATGSITITTTTPLVVRSRNANRVLLNMRNTSSSSSALIYFSQSRNPTARDYLLRQYDAYEFNLTNLYIGEIYIIASGADGTLSWMEVTKSDLAKRAM